MPAADSMEDAALQHCTSTVEGDRAAGAVVKEEIAVLNALCPEI